MAAPSKQGQNGGEHIGDALVATTAIHADPGGFFLPRAQLADVLASIAKTAAANKSSNVKGPFVVALEDLHRLDKSVRQFIPEDAVHTPTLSIKVLYADESSERFDNWEAFASEAFADLDGTKLNVEWEVFTPDGAYNIAMSWKVEVEKDTAFDRYEPASIEYVLLGPNRQWLRWVEGELLVILRSMALNSAYRPLKALAHARVRLFTKLGVAALAPALASVYYFTHPRDPRPTTRQRFDNIMAGETLDERFQRFVHDQLYLSAPDDSLLLVLAFLSLFAFAAVVMPGNLIDKPLSRLVPRSGFAIGPAKKRFEDRQRTYQFWVYTVLIGLVIGVVSGVLAGLLA